jgi:UDP:flavonoid glycosyltransferase YjiC (YdhE family)
MKILLVPGNNSLSHIAKCLAVKKEFLVRGHEVLIAVSKSNACFLDSLHIQYAILPDIQEIDHGATPSWEWFRHAEIIQTVVRAEMDLMRDFRPDRVLGVFRFTTKAAAAELGIPFDSLICGCMLPDNRETLGFAPHEAGAELQQHYLENFFLFAGRKLSRAIESLNSDGVGDIRWMLVGERTYLWDFPEFMPISHRTNRFHVGPLFWDRWLNVPKSAAINIPHDRPNALMTFGTCSSDGRVAKRLVNCLRDQGYNVLIAAGNQPNIMEMRYDSDRVRVWPFIPVEKLLPHSEVVISHGGQMTIFESLLHGVPVFVMPFQPEQAHNGVCLERIGCGCRLVPAVAYRGDNKVYSDCLMQRSRKEIVDIFESFMSRSETAVNLEQAQQHLRKYSGAANLVRRMIQE